MPPLHRPTLAQAPSGSNHRSIAPPDAAMESFIESSARSRVRILTSMSAASTGATG